jgi:hypothetical protein
MQVMTKIVEFVSGSPDMDFLEKFYDTTLSALKDSQNERLWFKTNMKLAKLWFDKQVCFFMYVCMYKHTFSWSAPLVQDRHEACQGVVS